MDRDNSNAAKEIAGMNKLSREEAREQSMQIVYQMDVNNDFDYRNLSIMDEYLDSLEDERCLAILDAVRDHVTEIDDTINTSTDKWNTARMAKTDLAILRVAVAEIFYIDGVPTAVAVNEAVEMGKKYGDDRSYAFINSVLGKIVRNK